MSGLGYPPPLLRGWRQLHEAFLGHEMRGLVAPCTMITEISVRQGPEALTARHVTLSKLSIITGPNDCGKSVLLDLLARAGRDPMPGRPWLGGCRPTSTGSTRSRTCSSSATATAPWNSSTTAGAPHRSPPRTAR